MKLKEWAVGQQDQRYLQPVRNAEPWVHPRHTEAESVFWHTPR